MKYAVIKLSTFSQQLTSVIVMWCRRRAGIGEASAAEKLKLKNQDGYLFVNYKYGVWN